MRRDPPTMKRDDVLALLREHLPVLRERFGVQRLRLFCSMARDTARQDSDVDVLADFGGPATADNFFGVQSIWKTCSTARSIGSPSAPGVSVCGPMSNATP
jgi:predicted nucleotidyltransferase